MYQSEDTSLKKETCTNIGLPSVNNIPLAEWIIHVCRSVEKCQNKIFTFSN